MTQTCVLTFTPVGQQIQEVQNCTMSMGGSQAAASPTPVAAFVMPGTSIQVLPIGLGVFGGITAVAVFFVAFVTWERIRYRKVCHLNDKLNRRVPRLFFNSCDRIDLPRAKNGRDSFNLHWIRWSDESVNFDRPPLTRSRFVS